MSWLDPGAGIVGGLLSGQPKLPDFNPLDVQGEQAKAIQGNIQQTPGLEQWAAGINHFNVQQLDQMLGQTIPMYGQLKGQVSSEISDLLAGKLPSDVQAIVQNQAAGSAISGGVAGSEFGRNITARDLGLTSLQLTQQGLNSAQSWLTTMDKIYSPAISQGQQIFGSMFITPQQQFAMDTQERNLQYQHDWAKNVLDWQGSLSHIVGQEMIQDSQAVADMVGDVVGQVGGKALGAMI